MGCRYDHRKGPVQTPISARYRRLNLPAPLAGAQVIVPALYIASNRDQARAAEVNTAMIDSRSRGGHGDGSGGTLLRSVGQN